MNRSIIALKEMINFSSIQRESMFVGLRHIFLALLLLSAGAGSAWAQTPWATPNTNDNAQTRTELGITGDGTEGNPYVITTAEQFAYFSYMVQQKKTSCSQAYWELGADIDLDGTNKTWSWGAGDGFRGHFDGNNHTISNVNISVTANTAYGVFTQISGASATNLAEVKNLNISGVTFTSTTPRANTTRLGGLAGYVKQANITNVSVSGVTFTYSEASPVTNSNQLGGAIGCMENNTILNNVDVTGVTATFGNTTTKLYLGGLVGQSGGTANTNSITNCDVKTVKVTHSSNITGETQLGGLVGQANTSLKVINNNTVAGQSSVNGGKAFDVSVSGTTVNFYAGGLLGYTIGDGHEVKNNTVEKVYITNTGTINGGRLGGFIGYVESNGTNGKVLVKGNTATTVNIQVDGNTVGTPYLGGFIGQAKGKASPDNRTLIQGNTVTSPTVTMNGEVYHNFYQGGFIGYVDANTNVFNNNVTTPVIKITNNIVNNSNTGSYVGGAIGAQANYTTVNGMTVSGGSIIGPTETKTVINNRNFFVGGFIGQQNSSGTANYQPNKFKNIAVSGMNINLGHYVPQNQIKDHKFSVGGIAGCVNAPNQDVLGNRGMPENLIAKSVKIYAPWAATSPTVPNFNTGAPAHNNLTTEVITSVDALEKSKTKTWYYYDYKLGLSTDFLSCTKVKAYNADPATDTYRKNYDASPATEDGISYLAINNTTFKKQNRYLDSDRDSWTVLWWTKDNGYNANGPTATNFTATEQPIYPNQNATTTAGNLTTYPYYMYFYQGVANATYVESAVAEKIIAGIEANKTQAAAANPVTLAITNDKENERGFAQRTITVAAKSTDGEGNETDVTGSYTYQWYVNGVAKSTGSTLTLTPHWKDGQGFTVNAISGGNVIATATYTLAPGVLKTKKSVADLTAELVRSDINGRGTKDNPYIIDHENALRQLSFLSTSHTGTRWEDIAMPIDPTTNKASNLITLHYNRAYYELGADITMTAAEALTPISHMGYSADGTWGSYNQNFIFQGHFDGKGYKISGLKITWGAGQYNGGAHVYHGLFGAVGNNTETAKWGEGTTTSPTVVKNLVIDGATMTHDVNNTSFYYNNGTSGNSNHCHVGVLAGIVSSNTTIQNIEIRNSSITDAGSSEYKLATKGLYVGGAIGSVQYSYGTESTAPVNIQIQHIAADVDVTLTKPAFDDATQQAQVNQFNVGGIIGRYGVTSATFDQTQAIMPAYTLYSGTVDAQKAWISPVVASVRYKDQNGNSWTNYSKHWEGNNNSPATQLTITNAQYYDFYIGTNKISETYPSNTCLNGFRTIASHIDAGEAQVAYDAQKYQGVNYGARCLDKNASLQLLNQERTDGYSWAWDDTPGFVRMTTEEYVEALISLVADTNNEFTASMTGATPTNYTWKVSFDRSLEFAQWQTVANGATETSYTVPVSLKPKYVMVEVTAGGKTYPTLVEMVDADENLCKPAITKDGSTYTFNLNQQASTPAPTLTTTYQWYSSLNNTFSGATSASFTPSPDQLSACNNVVRCKAFVSEYGVKIAEYFLVTGATVVYVNGNGYTGSDSNGDYGVGNNSNDGRSPQSPVLTIDHANSLLTSVADGGTWDTNIIVVMGMLNNNDFFRSNGKNPATITGRYNETDYEGTIYIKKTSGEDVVNPITAGNAGLHCYVLADTKFENLTFNGANEDNAFIECHGNDVWFGKGLKMKNFKNLSKAHGNMDAMENIPEFTILLTATNLNEDYVKKYTDRTKPQVVTFLSGRYGRIMAGRYTNAFFAKDENTSHTILGSPAKPVWAILNIDIDNDNPNKGTVIRDEAPNKGTVTDNYTCDINCIIAGLTDGCMYGDYVINVHGGKIKYIVGGNQGNPVPNKLGYTGANYNMPGGTIAGSWGHWPNATYFGRTVINVEQKDGCKPIDIQNLYAGGLGREANGNSATSVVDMFFYGRTQVNMKSGKISGNAYAGGAGGVIGVNPWDVHLPYATDAADNDAASAIQNGVQYGDSRVGSWSKKTAGTDALATVTLHHLDGNNGNEGFLLDDEGHYIDEKVNLGESSTTVNITGGEIGGNVYGGGCGFVSNMPYQVCMQGVGSIFGTSNVNISGGTIGGSVYGGSQGDSKYYNQVNKYGQTINHVAEMNGTVNLNITGTAEKSPVIKGDIFGAGMGLETAYRKAVAADVTNGLAEKVNDPILVDEYNRVATTGNLGLDAGGKYKTTVNLTIDINDANHLDCNVFGGGKMGMVDGDINVHIVSGQINGNVYGGGKGEKNHLKKATVNGTTNVKIGN